jgi:predicted nucleotidyltransferase
MPQRKMLLRTVHGSYLYGLNTPTSDRDFYEIYDYPWQRYRPRKQNQQVIDKYHHDTTTISLERFTDLCIKGVPQSIEVLFSDSSKWSYNDHSWYHIKDTIKDLVCSNIPGVLETYRRTAWNFFEKDDFKKNRHALRLCANAKDLKTKGSFDPTLTPNVREEMTRIAALPRRQREDIFKDIFFDAFGDL